MRGVLRGEGGEMMTWSQAGVAPTMVPFPGSCDTPWCHHALCTCGGSRPRLAPLQRRVLTSQCWEQTPEPEGCRHAPEHGDL